MGLLATMAPLCDGETMITVTTPVFFCSLLRLTTQASNHGAGHFQNSSIGHGSDPAFDPVLSASSTAHANASRTIRSTSPR